MAPTLTVLFLSGLSFLCLKISSGCSSSHCVFSFLPSFSSQCKLGSQGPHTDSKSLASLEIWSSHVQQNVLSQKGWMRERGTRGIFAPNQMTASCLLSTPGDLALPGAGEADSLEELGWMQMWGRLHLQGRAGLSGETHGEPVCPLWGNPWEHPP